MSRILRFFVCLGTLFFAGNALAAGYSCSSLPTYLSCQHGYYMTANKSSTTHNGTPKVGNYCQPCSKMGSNYTCAGGTAAPVQSAGGYTCPTYKKYTSCSVGYYMTSNSTSTAPNGTPAAGNACRPCSAYGANYTCAGGTAAPQAITVNVTCQAGQYLPKGATSCTTCPAGSYCPSQTCSGVSLVTGATSACGITSCRTATSYYFESAAGSSNINDCYRTLSVAEKVETVNNGLDYCTSGEYCDNDGRKVYYDEYNEERDLTDSRPTIARGTACARGSYSDDEATACEPCPKGKTTSGTGSGSCGVTCSNSANVATWVTPTWTPNYVSNSCKIASCVACTKGAGVASCSASIVNNTCTYTATCASGYKNPTCNGSSCSCELDSVTCSAGQYLPAGATSCATCPKGYKCPSSSKTYTVSTTADQGNTPCSGSTEYQDATGQTSCKTPSDGYYKKDNTSQQVCGTGYFCKSGVRTACTTYGTGYTTDTTTSSVNTQCYLNVAGGKVRNGTTGTTLNTCGVGKFKRPHHAYYGTSYSCDSCPAAESGWTMGTDTGLMNYTACYETKAATSISNYCSAGQLKKNATSTTAWGTATVSTAFQAKSGSIVNGQTCTQCIGATWSSGGTATSCSACPSGYTANTTPGKSAETQCQIVVDGGKYIAAAKATTPTNCPMDTYKAEHYVNYGSTSSCTRCPTGYGVTGGYGISESSCYISVDKGKYLGTAKGTTFSTCAAGTYKTAHNVYYGSISSCDACRGRTKYSSAGASSCSTVSSGYYTTGCNSSNNSCTGQSQCTGATYCTSGVQNNCPGSYTANTTAGKTAASQCQISVSKGHYIGTANSSTASSCAAGTYKAAHNVNYGSTSSCSSCPTGYTASAGTAGVEGECYISVGAGKYLGTAKGTTLSTCAAGTFKVAHTVNYGGTSSCGVCGDNLYSDAGAGACTACATANGYKNSGTTAASHAGVASCKATCAAGTYVATAGTACTTVGTGYWGAGGTVSQNTTLGRNQCPEKYRDGAAATQKSDCAVLTTAGRYIAAPKATEQTKCPAKNYCPSESVKYGETNSPKACPTADATTARTTYPDDYLNPTRLSINNQGWSTGLPAITSCSANYTFTNAAGNFSVESVGYNATTGKYENGGGKYYTFVNAGWYLVDKYSETYCDEPTNRMLYHNVAECTANSYCPGYNSMPLCSTGTHNDEMGRFECRDLGNGYNYSPAKSGAKTACYLTTSNSKFVAAAGAAESACTAGGWCPGGVRVNYGSTGGRNTCPTKYPSSAASSNSELDCYVTTAAGKYVATVGAGQVNCAGTGYYCPGGTNVYSGAYGSRLTTGGRTQCPAGYRDLVATASTTKEAQCTMNVAGGKYVATAKESAASGTCAAGYAKAAHSVTYGNTSSCAACTGTTYAENTGQASCTACPTQSGVTNISYWISTGTHTDAKGCYGFYNDVALNNGSVARIQCFWDKTKSQYDTSCGAMKDGLKCNAAYYNAILESSPTNNAAYYTDKASVIAKACTSVGKGYWSPADVYTRTQCPAGYRDGTAGVSEAQCTMNVAGGKYVAKANESAASGTCAAGYAKAAHSVTYGNTSSCAACTGATYAASTGQASCTACPTAKTYASAVKSYGYWNNGKDGDHTISDGCYATMTGTLSNGSLTEHGCYLGTDGDYGNGGGKRCYVHQDNLKCNAGYYASTLSNGYVWNNTRAGLLGNTCVGVGAGYYSAANILTRNQCPTGLTTIGYGAGADEVTDCGRILHFGNDKLYLRSGKKTTPSLNVKIGDTTYYGNMTAGTGKGKLRLKSGTTTYSVHDDSM